MKYMMTVRIPPENMKAAIDRFKEDPKDPKPGSGAKIIGRWHEFGTGKAFVLLEADDPIGVAKHCVAWADLSDTKIVAVLEDEEMGKALE